MPQFTLDQLRDLMRSCTDTDDVAGRLDLDRDITATQFSDLDFDSLAVLELATRIQQDYDVPMPDEAIAEMTTPQAVLDYVNGQMAVR